MTTLMGKVILLTGASGGIGGSIARALAKEQAIIVGVARSLEGLEKVGSEIRQSGGQWFSISHDISNLDQLPELIETIQHQVGSVDILINNAGIEIYRAFQDYTQTEIQSVLATNLLAAMELSRLLLPSMLREGSGHIVSIASLAAKKGHPYDSIYSASKAGLLVWSDAVRQELYGTGVEISTLCPGYVSGKGLLVDTGLPAPALSGTSTPEQVATAVIRAIQTNQPEVLVNKDGVTEGVTKLLLMLWQLFPRWGDRIYRWIGVTQLNQRRASRAELEPATAASSVLPLRR